MSQHTISPSSTTRIHHHDSDRVITHPVHLRPSIPQLSSEQADHLARQEIGYIGAAYRHDRDIEARLESARNASELHYQRTQRRLFVSKELLSLGLDMPELSKLESDPDRRKRSHRSSGHVTQI